MESTQQKKGDFPSSSQRQKKAQSQSTPNRPSNGTPVRSKGKMPKPKRDSDLQGDFQSDLQGERFGPGDYVHDDSFNPSDYSDDFLPDYDPVHVCYGGRQSNRKTNQRKGGRKKELVPLHLLNFTSAPIVEPPRPSYKKKIAPSQPYIREKFLQANFRFIMKPDKDYSLMIRDPDLCPDWEDVQCLVMSSTTAYECPVCLGPPKIPRISRCGHIFCWACLLQYASLQGYKKWVRCPICFESLLLDQLKCTRFDQKVTIENKVSFKLMKRPKSSTRIVAKNKYLDLKKELFFPASHSGAQFCRFTLSSEEFYRTLLAEDLSAVEAAIWTANSEQCESRPYLEEIRRQILEQITDIPSLPSPLSLNSTDIALSGDGTVGGEGSNVVQASEMVVNDWEEREGEEEKQENISPKLKNVKQEKEGRNDDFFYFYQSDDGQQAFLHPVCSRILQTEFGSLWKCPLELKDLRILEIDHLHQSDSTRRRYKFLSHIPITSPFSFVEVDLTEVVSEETLKTFTVDLRKRESARLQAKRDREKEIEQQKEEEKKKKESYREPENLLDDCPQLGYETGPQIWGLEEDFPSAASSSPPISSSYSSSSSSSPWHQPPPPQNSVVSVASSPPSSHPQTAWGSPPQSSSGNKGPSFAQVLRTRGSQTWNGAPQGKQGKKRRQKLMSTTSSRSYK
eukprot:CAMPEP_0201492886 /NCGR_PEP_ID=MMETSP0151_2-20130828/35162_1 /ASSEMBLY_ACC=CAM_ASM_000257 /TAXON_ID=200890 /ORGANISM="Paramoeba atlantica, Strain 621/1 / CCAP 1560/9" /LENGTH=678 /DNA_ID=CAMNT_0047879955 /DNA_START=31 /DNA_END=2067 /DNA_ORIENTATION=-